jgi:hypothetical protein
MKIKALIASLSLSVVASIYAANPVGVAALCPVEDGNLASESCWTDPHVKYVVIRDWWSNVEATQGTYYWGYYNQGMTLANHYGKQIICQISMGVEAPSWLYTANPPVVERSTPKGDMPLPWDQNFLNWSTSTGYADTIIHHFENHLHFHVYGSTVAAITIWDGGENGTEDFFNCANQTEASQWQSAAQYIALDWYYNAWYPMWLATGNPFPGDGGVTMTNVAQWVMNTNNIPAGWILGLESNGLSNTYPNGSYFAHTKVLLSNSGWICYQAVDPIKSIGCWLYQEAQNAVTNNGKVWEIYWSTNGNDRDNDPGIGNPQDPYQGDAALQWFNTQVGAPNP